MDVYAWNKNILIIVTRRKTFGIPSNEQQLELEIILSARWPHLFYLYELHADMGYGKYGHFGMSPDVMYRSWEVSARTLLKQAWMHKACVM